MKEEAGLSSRCMPFEQEHISDVCPCCDAKAQLFGAGVAHRQRMVHGLAVQPEGAGEHKIEGEAFGFDGIIRAQLQLDGIALGLEQGVLHVAGKTVLTALVRFAARLKGAAGQLARPREQNGAWRFQTAGSACQSISCPAAFFRLTASAPWVSTVKVRNSL